MLDLFLLIHPLLIIGEMLTKNELNIQLQNGLTYIPSIEKTL